MSTCTQCASLQPDTSPESHPALRRQAVRQRFLDVFETYECLECSTHWERAVLTEDKHPVRYRWKLTSGPALPPSSLLPDINWGELDHALASWLSPTLDRHV
jgi:hypothetical protein